MYNKFIVYVNNIIHNINMYTTYNIFSRPLSNRSYHVLRIVAALHCAQSLRLVSCGSCRGDHAYE